MATVDLADYLTGDETALMGREDGDMLQAMLQADGIRFDEMEMDTDGVTIYVPDHIVNINPAYLQAVWGPRMAALGPTSFHDLYSFQAIPSVQRKVSAWIASQSFPV